MTALGIQKFSLAGNRQGGGNGPSTLRLAGLIIGGIVLVLALVVVYFAQSTRGQINGFEQRVIDAAQSDIVPSLPDSPAGMAALPSPVQRYFQFTFPQGVPAQHKWVEVEMSGQFRRPLTDSFQSTTARQVARTSQPDMVFSADTPLLGPLWAIAYDVYIGGEMEMAARLMSAVTVMQEGSSPVLDQISLRRWLLESPTYPMGLLPGGPVTWEAVDETHARAVIRAYGQEASLLAEFSPEGALIAFRAETDGDLTTPYHGSGEVTLRGDFQLVQGVRVPMSFTIARAAGGQVFPFWQGRVTSLRFGGE